MAPVPICKLYLMGSPSLLYHRFSPRNLPRKVHTVFARMTDFSHTPDPIHGSGRSRVGERGTALSFPFQIPTYCTALNPEWLLEMRTCSCPLLSLLHVELERRLRASIATASPASMYQPRAQVGSSSSVAVSSRKQYASPGRGPLLPPGSNVALTTGFSNHNHKVHPHTILLIVIYQHPL